MLNVPFLSQFHPGHYTISATLLGYDSFFRLPVFINLGSFQEHWPDSVQCPSLCVCLIIFMVILRLLVWREDH